MHWGCWSPWAIKSITVQTATIIEATNISCETHNGVVSTMNWAYINMHQNKLSKINPIWIRIWSCFLKKEVFFPIFKKILFYIFYIYIYFKKSSVFVNYRKRILNKSSIEKFSFDIFRIIGRLKSLFQTNHSSRKKR